jgi:flagellar basal body-associated protein FliL
MNATDKEKTQLNTTPTTNQRLITILLVLLIVLVALLITGIVAGWLMMGSGMMGWGGMMGINGQTMNNMISACADMMRNFQNP